MGVIGGVCQHFVWSTKHREPLLVGEVEALVHKALRGKAIALGAHVFALNGTADHVHLVTAIPPKLAVAKFVGQIKAVASTALNKAELSDMRFAWQSEYGAFSFDAKRLPYYIAYVERQKEHHARQHTIPSLNARTAIPHPFSMTPPLPTSSHSQKQRTQHGDKSS